VFYVKQAKRVSWHSQVCCFGLKGYKKNQNLAGEKMREKVSNKMKCKVVMQSQKVKHYF
jgi:hypothetical protein